MTRLKQLLLLFVCEEGQTSTQLFCKFKKKTNDRHIFYLSHSLHLHRISRLNIRIPLLPTCFQAAMEETSPLPNPSSDLFDGLSPSKKPDEEKWLSLPSSSPASSLPANSIPPAQKVPESPTS